MAVLMAGAFWMGTFFAFGPICFVLESWSGWPSPQSVIITFVVGVLVGMIVVGVLEFRRRQSGRRAGSRYVSCIVGLGVAVVAIWGVVAEAALHAKVAVEQGWYPTLSEDETQQHVAVVNRELCRGR